MKDLAVENLTVDKGGKRILDDVTLSFPSGALSAVIGPNGAGKSTLFRTLAGLEAGSRGTLHWGETVLDELDMGARAKTLSWVPDGGYVPFPYTVEETVLLGRFPWHQGQPSQKDQRLARIALDHVGLGDFTERKVTSLSAGELRKVMIARALAGDAEILLFDEPCANLDIAAALDLCHLFRQLAREGRTILFTVHDVSLADRFADHVACLSKGAVAASGSVEDILTSELLGTVFLVEVEQVPLAAGERHLRFSRRQARRP